MVKSSFGLLEVHLYVKYHQWVRRKISELLKLCGTLMERILPHLSKIKEQYLFIHNSNSFSKKMSNKKQCDFY